MGEIIDFRKTARDFGRKANAVNMAGAQILFFTGVRYQRHADDQISALALGPHDDNGQGSGQNSRKRKRRA